MPACLVVVDHDAFVVPDLDSGAVHLASLTQVLELLEGEAAPSPGSVPLSIAAARTIEPLAADELGLVTPTVLRLHDGQLLAWDGVQQGHVALGAAHLHAIDELHEARRSAGEVHLSAPSTADPSVRADLVALGLATVGSDAWGPSATNGPNAAAAAAHEVIVELGRRNGTVAEQDAAQEPADEPSAPTGDDIAPDSPPQRHVPAVSTAPGRSALLPRAARLSWRVIRGFLRILVRVARRVARRVLAARRGGSPTPSVAPSVSPDLTTTEPPPVAVVAEPGPSDLPAGDLDAPSSDVVESSAPAVEPSGGVVEIDLSVADRPELRFEWDERIPVIPLYSWGTISQDCGQLSDEVEPVLSIGMLMAHARACRGGELEQRYDFVRIRPDSTEVLAAWAANPRPAIFLFSDYLWNLDQHLEWGRMVKELSPESLCIHGGPSCPKYEADAAAFVTDNPGVDLAVRGEGELVFEQLLVTLDGDIDPLRLDRLEGVGSLTYLDHRSGEPRVVRTADAGRPEQLDDLPSPYLSGEFDELLAVPWRSASIETNRGCPYGCTFCDWGSATLSRIRKFDLDRVRAELDWVMEHATPPDIMITDANFGIFARDLEVADHLAELRGQHQMPYTVTISGMAKNTVKHSVPIIQTFVRAGIGPIAAQSVQSTDEATLSAIRRHNIKLERFDDMARAFKELGLPLVTDILMGLPGSTVESFKNDLQDCLDREVTARTMEILKLPNSPMNDPEYRREWKVEADEYGVVCASSTFTRDDYEQMKRLRLLYRAVEHFGLLRHVLRHLQWEHGLRALDVIHDIDRAIVRDPVRYPLLAFVGRVFDIYTVPPVAWEPFFDEVVDFLHAEYGLTLDGPLATVLSVQRAVLPARNRAFPDVIELEHDYVEYRRDRSSLADGAVPSRLADYGPGRLQVSDPTGVCDRYIQRNEMPDRRDHTTSNLFWVGYDWELDSPLMRHLVTNVTKTDVVV